MSYAYEMELWRQAKRGAKMTALLIRAAKLISGIRRDASHMTFFMARSVNQDMMLPDPDISSADDHCRIEHARPNARQTAAATAATMYVYNDRCSPGFGVKLSAPYAQE